MQLITVLSLSAVALAQQVCPPSACDRVPVTTDWYHRGQSKKDQLWLQQNTITPKCVGLKDTNRLLVGDVKLEDVLVTTYDYSDDPVSGRRFRASGTVTCVFNYLKL
jgi:hypothetical protein